MVVVDARELVVAIENVDAAINQIAQTTLRNIVEQHSQDEVLAETSVINGSIREILDTTTVEGDVEVTQSAGSERPQILPPSTSVTIFVALPSA